ncbi:MCE family protein [Rhodococcus sp. D2-41]|uniref:MCE family protein n=1 Tax=Speluncibacter jeojiensis TaxID=2710754 RepID=UPI00241002F1|nr:MCE family protein [Rhodococcus sp. D2-41]MDG3010673.1 MCE family protein [Rhodococcus sp. D2-41]
MPTISDHPQRPGWVRKLAAVGLVAAVAGAASLALVAYTGGLHAAATVTVISQRAGLVMDPGARVKLRGVTIGKVGSIRLLGDDEAELVLRVDPAALGTIASNARVDIASPTVFGAKDVEFEDPPSPSPARLTDGSVVRASNVTVELNSVFQRLTAVLDTVEPHKLDATLSAIATTLTGRGAALGTALDRADQTLRQLNSAGPALEHDLAALAPVTATYADVAPNLMHTAANATALGRTVIEQSKNLDLLLLNTVGLANTGRDLLGDNSAGLTTVLDVLRPTTGLLAEYSPGIPCLFKGLDASSRIGHDAYSAQPGVKMSFGLLMGAQSYRYPQDLPKVAATGGPHCMGLPDISADQHAKYLVTDTGVNPLAPDNQGPKVNAPSAADLMSYLFGVPVDPAALRARAGK